MLYLDRYKYLARKCHSMEFVWSETLRNNRKWGFFDLQKNRKRFPMAVWAFAVRPERQRFTLLQKAPCGFALSAQQEWEEKAPSEMKDEERCKKKNNQLPKFWGLSKSASSLTLGCFSLGAPARPSCSCYEANSHICWEDRRWDRKTLNKAAKTGWHNNPLLCLRGAESWDVRVCNWMSDLFFFCSI